MIPTAGPIAAESLEEQDAIVMVPKRKTSREKEKERKANEKKEKKDRKVVDDPFDVAEVEPGHRYASWRGGRVSIKPGQIIPSTKIGDTPTLRGVDIDGLPSRASSRNAAMDRLEGSGSTKGQHLKAPDIYDSVLHDVLLTPTYLRRSPAIPPTPSPSSSHGEGWHDDTPSKRLTLVDALRRGSRMLRWNGHDRSVRDGKDREVQELAKFRQAVRPVRFADDPVVGYSSSPRWTQLGSAHARRSPATREWGVGVSWGDGKRSEENEKAWREKKQKEKQNKRRRMWKVSVTKLLLRSY